MVLSWPGQSSSVRVRVHAHTCTCTCTGFTCPHLVFLGGSGGRHRERASFISSETTFHLLFCYLQNTSPGVASWKTTFVVDFGEGIGIF